MTDLKSINSKLTDLKLKELKIEKTWNWNVRNWQTLLIIQTKLKFQASESSRKSTKVAPRKFNQLLIELRESVFCKFEDWTSLQD